MHVAYVCTDPGVPVFGCKGCSIHVQEVLREFVRRGWTVDLFARRFDQPHPPELASVRAWELGKLPAGLEMATREQMLLSLDRKLRVALEARGPYDLVYERYALWSSAAMRYAREHRIPSVLEVNAPLIAESSVHRQIVALDDATRISAEVFEAAGAVIGVSQAVANYVQNFPRIDADKVCVVTNGVDVDRFAQTRQKIQARWTARTAGELPSDAPITIGFVGSLRPWHGMEVLAAAFRAFHRVHSTSRLLIVGDGPARKDLEKSLGSSARPATQMVGSVPHESVAQWLAEIDIAVAPYPQTDSRSFYFSPLKLLEYMAAGIPLVASHLGDIPRIVRHNVDGLLVEPGSIEAMTAAWEFLSGDPRAASRLSHQAVQRVSERFSWRHVVDKTVAWGLARAGSSRHGMARSAV